MKKRGLKLHKAVDAVLTYCILIAVCAIFLFPILWLEIGRAHF